MKITYDIHIHTNLSSCGKPYATLESYIEGAKRDQIGIIGISNHLWDSDVPGASDWYAPQNVDHLLQLKKEIPENSIVDGVKVFFGCETEFAYTDRLALTEEHMALFDYIIVPHSHTHMGIVMPKEYKEDHNKHAKFLMDSFLNVVNHPLSKYFTTIAHPFVPGVSFDIYNEVQSRIPDSYFKEAFDQAKEKGIAIEINGSTIVFHKDEEVRNCEFRRIYTIAKERGCKFTYGSDAHNGINLNRKKELLEEFIGLCGIQDEDMLKPEEFCRI